MPWHGHRYETFTPDTETPHLAVGGTVFGPHDGQFRRSFVLAFAQGFEKEVKDANQQLAKALADRLNAEAQIATANPPLAIVEQLVRKHAPGVIAECGGSFQFNKTIFSHIQGNGVII